MQIKKFLYSCIAVLILSTGCAPGAYAGPGAGVVQQLFVPPGVGAMPRTFQAKAAEVVSVLDFGAKGDGVTNDLGALQKAAAALKSNQELHFPPGVYKLAWAGAKPEKSTIALDLVHLQNIKIIGHAATILVQNHDVQAYGGLLFAHIRASQNVEVYGFDVQMNFINSNKDAAFYPESGFLYGHNITENASSWPIPAADRLGNVYVHNINFNIQSQYGAYTTSQNAYQGDTNNGGKYYTVFIRGEQAEQTYAGQNKGVKITDLTYADSHQAYGVWVWGFSDVEISRNHFYGWATRTGDYQNTTLGGSVPAIRCHKFFTQNWRIEGNIIRSRDPAMRTGILDGGGALISFQQEATAYNSASNVTIANNTLVVGSNTSGQPVSIYDSGVEIKTGGNFDISRNNFSSNASLPGGNAIMLNDYYSAFGIRQFFNITGNTFDTSAEKLYSVAYSSASPTSAADRAIRSLVFTNNTINGYYKSVIVRAGQGRTFEGAAFQAISDNRINGTENTTIPSGNVNNVPFDIYVEQGGDAAQINNNLIVAPYLGIRVAGASADATHVSAANNNVIGGTYSITGIQNYKPNSLVTLTTFASASPVVVQGPNSSLYSVIGLALDATGLVKDRLAGNFSGGTTLVNAPTGYTWQVFQFEIAK